MTDVAVEMGNPPAPKPKKESRVYSGNAGMIVPFWGEFLHNACAMDWALNYCSHGCSYCFANLNAPTRNGDASKALRQIADIGKRSTFTDWLLRNKYPICISNKIDAFSESNYRECLPVMQAMKEHGVPIMFQTKGAVSTGANQAIAEVLEGLPPSVWYITLSQDTDAMRKKIEPGAPSLDARFELIDMLDDLGHWVVIGNNPCVSEWIESPQKFAQRMADAGVWGVWMERLHLSEKQLQFMPQGHQKALSEHGVLQRALLAKKTPREDGLFLQEMRGEVVAAGMEPYNGGWPGPTEFFLPWRECYPKTMPMIQDVANMMFAADAPDGALLSFAKYIELMEAVTGPLPKGKMHIGDYMRVASWRSIEHFTNWSDNLTFKQLLWFTWQYAVPHLSPAAGHGNFAQAVIPDGDGGYDTLTDEDGTAYYLFIRDGIGEKYCVFDVDTGTIMTDEKMDSLGIEPL